MFIPFFTLSSLSHNRHTGGFFPSKHWLSFRVRPCRRKPGQGKDGTERTFRQNHVRHSIWLVVSNIFMYFHPYLGKIPNLSIFFKWGGSTTNQSICSSRFCFFLGCTEIVRKEWMPTTGLVYLWSFQACNCFQLLCHIGACRKPCSNGKIIMTVYTPVI